MNPLQVYSAPRHLRYMFFIDSEASYEIVLELIKKNLRLWGGRYNPIVPVTAGVIDPAYLGLIRHYDPDIILHSGSVDPEMIKRLRLFSPSAYLNLDLPATAVLGVRALYLLSIIGRHRPVILPFGLYKVESPLRDYFHVNFGIEGHSYVGDDLLAIDRNKLSVGPSDFDQLHFLLHGEQPVLQSELAGIGLHTTILRNAVDTLPDSFEIVLAKDTSSTADLLYFWNRRLYECFNILYITVEQLTHLSNDIHFGGFLFDLAPSQHITMVSRSIQESDLKDLVAEHLNSAEYHRIFLHKNVDHFPFNVDTDSETMWMPTGRPVIQTLNTHDTALFVPPFPFSGAITGMQKWAIDLEILELRENEQREIMFPRTTNAGGLTPNADGRINGQRRLNYYAGGERSLKHVQHLKVSPFPDIIQELISAPVIDGVQVKTKYQAVGPHDPSNRLTAFIELFRGNFSLIEEYLADRFWTKLFDELCTSEKAAGDAISLKDLHSRCKMAMEQQGIVFGVWPATRNNDENLMLGLQEMLQDLTTLRVFIPGHTLKCTRCSTIAWYPLEQVTSRVRCAGCMEAFQLPIDPAFTYRLNSLVQKNIFQSKTQRDGNLTIIRTLAHLAKLAPHGIEFSPQLNLYADFSTRTPETDLDIVAFQHNRFIIGESKYNSTEFNADSHKSLLGLVEVALAVRPDQVLISCTQDAHNRLKNAKLFLEHQFSNILFRPVVTTHQVSEPTYVQFTWPGRYFYH
jgi:hypothetical protein